VELHVFVELFQLGRHHVSARYDLLCFVVAFVGCVFDIMYGMMAAVSLNCLIVIYKQSRPHTHAHASHPQGCLMFRIDGPIIFSNASCLQDRLRRSEQRHFGSHAIHRIDSQEDEPHTPLPDDHDIDVLVDQVEGDVEGDGESRVQQQRQRQRHSSSNVSINIVPGQVCDDLEAPLISPVSSSSSSSSSTSDLSQLLSPASSSSSSSMRVLVLDMSSVTDIDITGVKTLEELHQLYSSRSPPVSLRFACVRPKIQALILSSCFESITEESFFSSVQAAMTASS